MTRTPLESPAARQGPGPMPQRLLEALDLVMAQRASGVLPGDRRAVGLGSGTELAQLRPYQVGDDVRQIDPAATARTGQPHVRLHVPERTLTTWLVLDISPSMAFGTADRLKIDVAEGAALALGHAAIRRAGRVALLTFGAGDVGLVRPRASRPGLVALRRRLGEGVAADGQRDARGLADALTRVGKVATQPGLIVVISDFRDQDDWTRPIGALRARHSLLAVEVSDPREGELPAVGHLALVDPETGERVEVDTSRGAVRRRFAQIEAESRARVARELRRLRIEHLRLSTGDDWLRKLGSRLR
ncbi:MAG: hypothetical protein QOK25_1651 [Thermoleophilaceae bacterium]|nr:hypothetical protein [Thermoleophilaceae bacterium]